MQKPIFLGSVKSNKSMAKYYFSPDQVTISGKGGKTVEFNLGQGQKIKDSNKVAESLLVRDYQEIANFQTGDKIGMVFVPENYIPLNPRVVDSDTKLEDLDNKDHLNNLNAKEKKRVEGQFRQAPGEAAEREVYEGLQKCLKDKDENGLIIAGLDIGKLSYDFYKIS